MIGRADIEGSKSNVAMNAWLPQASYPCDVPPQPNSPPDNVFRPDRPAEAGLGSKKRGIAPLPIHGIIGFPLSVPVLSWLFDARGRPPKEPFPVRPAGRHAATPLSPRKQLEQSADSRRVRDWDPRAQPTEPILFPRYGSILPTSLAYIVPSTRGCSPWRPDAVMSTTGRGRHSVLRIFKGRRGRTGHRATCGALPAAGPYLRLSHPHRRPLRPGSRPKVSAQFGTVTRLPVHPASPVLLTKNGPLGALDSVARLNEAAAPSYLFKTVRLVFRPYTQVRRTICTSVSLRASTRVSSGFAPLRHSSPSFGSRQACSHSNPSQKIKGRSAVHPARGDPANQLPCALRVYSPVDSHHMSDSLVRVSRRAEWGAHRPVPGARRYIAETARAANHDRRDGISTSLSTARALAAAPIRTDSASWCDRVRGTTGLSPSLAPPSRGLGPGPPLRTLLQTTIRTARPSDYSSWADPGSLAVTKGILGTPVLGQPHHKHGRPNLRPDAMCPDKGCMVGGDAMRDAQAGGFDNDPSAGSPTETLLRLLLPLNDKVQWNSRDVAGRRTAHVAAILTLHRTHSIGRRRTGRVCTSGRDLVNAS
ncbi:hypothetical protein L1887_61021 [Cichorium endivia]|nr:hypothetical protein L1887_61021 [Cichorium endivia]